MNFLNNEIEHTLTLSTMLTTREVIEATASFVVYGRIRANLYVPFTKDKPYQENVRYHLICEAESAVHQWALDLPSAEDCLSKQSYVSLERSLRQITSPEFNVGRVTVRNLRPVSPKVEKPPELPEKEKALQRTIRELTEDEEISVVIEHFGAKIYHRYPELKGTKQGDRLEQRYYSKALSIFADRNAK